MKKHGWLPKSGNSRKQIKIEFLKIYLKFFFYFTFFLIFSTFEFNNEKFSLNWNYFIYFYILK